jgi:hypothetical protein
VIIVDRPKRTHDRDVIGAASDVLKPIAHNQAALAIRLVARLERHDFLAAFVVGIASDDILVGIGETSLNGVSSIDFPAY